MTNIGGKNADAALRKLSQELYEQFGNHKQRIPESLRTEDRSSLGAAVERVVPGSWEINPVGRANPDFLPLVALKLKILLCNV
jgi:hypothetical protein